MGDSLTLPEIHVAAGILRDDSGRVLVAQRPPGKSHSGAWEFPGGKIHRGELPLDGLSRELHEELGIGVRIARHLTRYHHDYRDQRVYLYVWIVEVWTGQPQGLEGQALQWLKPAQLMAQGLLPADEVIADLLQASALVNCLPVEAVLRQQMVSSNSISSEV